MEEDKEMKFMNGVGWQATSLLIVKIDGIGHGARELPIASWFGYFSCF